MDFKFVVCDGQSYNSLQNWLEKLMLIYSFLYFYTMNEALVSILTPFKNTEAFIAECLDSIVAQTYCGWELIIVDDHSTDNSYNIVHDCAQKDKRIKLIRTEGHGIIEALRTAFKNSTGAYITRMDSDDIMSPQKLETMTAQLQSHGSGHIALGMVNYFSDAGISDGYSRYEKWLNELTQKGDNFSDIYKECVIASPCWMVHRFDLIASGAFEPNRYPEDYDLTFRFYESGLVCLPSDQILHYWRDYSWRTSRTHEHYALNYFLDIKLHYFLKLNYDTKRPLVVLGAGYKGKTIATYLIEHNIEFYWICDNPRKIGIKIYDTLLYDYPSIDTLKNPQIIVSVANDEAQKEIKTLFKAKALEAMKDYFFFC